MTDREEFLPLQLKKTASIVILLGEELESTVDFMVNQSPNPWILRLDILALDFWLKNTVDMVFTKS